MKNLMQTACKICEIYGPEITCDPQIVSAFLCRKF